MKMYMLRKSLTDLATGYGKYLLSCAPGLLLQRREQDKGVPNRTEKTVGPGRMIEEIKRSGMI